MQQRKVEVIFYCCFFLKKSLLLEVLYMSLFPPLTSPIPHPYLLLGPSFPKFDFPPLVLAEVSVFVFVCPTIP